MTEFMKTLKNLSILAIWDSSFLVSPLFGYTFSFSIGKCSLLPTLEVDATQHFIWSLCCFYTALMLTAKSRAQRAPLPSFELNIHLPPVFQIYFGATQARRSRLLLFWLHHLIPLTQVLISASDLTVNPVVLGRNLSSINANDPAT